jgi:hypothetical protein
MLGGLRCCSKVDESCVDMFVVEELEGLGGGSGGGGLGGGTEVVADALSCS